MMDERSSLVRARTKMHLTQKEAATRLGVDRATLQRWEQGITMPRGYNVVELCKLYQANEADLGLEIPANEENGVNGMTLALPISDSFGEGSPRAILEQIAIGIEVCNSLSDSGGHSEIVGATQIAATYLPMLQALLSTSKYRSQAAVLASKVYQHQHGTAYHVASVALSLAYSEKAVEYARIAQNVTELIVALYELASTYEWPLPPMSVHACRKKGLEMLEEAVSLQEQKRYRDVVPFQIQSWVYAGYAKFLALNGRKQDAYQAMGNCTDRFAKKGNDLPGLYFNEVNINRQQAIAHSYLSEQKSAISGFLGLLDVRESGIVPRFAMSDRTQLSIISETVFSSLKLPMPAKDKNLTMSLWNQQFDMAVALKSATYVKECWKTYEIMACVWPDDASVESVRDRLFSLESPGF